jgi:hypothetical protein
MVLSWGGASGSGMGRIPHGRGKRQAVFPSSQERENPFRGVLDRMIGNATVAVEEGEL